MTSEHAGPMPAEELAASPLLQGMLRCTPPVVQALLTAPSELSELLGLQTFWDSYHGPGRVSVLRGLMVLVPDRDLPWGPPGGGPSPAASPAASPLNSYQHLNTAHHDAGAAAGQTGGAGATQWSGAGLPAANGDPLHAGASMSMHGDGSSKAAEQEQGQGAAAAAAAAAVRLQDGAGRLLCHLAVVKEAVWVEDRRVAAGEDSGGDSQQPGWALKLAWRRPGAPTGTTSFALPEELLALDAHAASNAPLLQLLARRYELDVAVQRSPALTRKGVVGTALSKVRHMIAARVVPMAMACGPSAQYGAHFITALHARPVERGDVVRLVCLLTGTKPLEVTALHADTIGPLGSVKGPRADTNGPGADMNGPVADTNGPHGALEDGPCSRMGSSPPTLLPGHSALHSQVAAPASAMASIPVLSVVAGMEYRTCDSVPLGSHMQGALQLATLPPDESVTYEGALQQWEAAKRAASPVPSRPDSPPHLTRDSTPPRLANGDLAAAAAPTPDTPIKQPLSSHELWAHESSSRGVRYPAWAHGRMGAEEAHAAEPAGLHAADGRQVHMRHSPSRGRPHDRSRSRERSQRHGRSRSRSPARHRRKHGRRSRSRSRGQRRELSRRHSRNKHRSARHSRRHSRSRSRSSSSGRSGSSMSISSASGGSSGQQQAQPGLHVLQGGPIPPPPAAPQQLGLHAQPAQLQHDAAVAGDVDTAGAAEAVAPPAAQQHTPIDGAPGSKAAELAWVPLEQPPLQPAPSPSKPSSPGFGFTIRSNKPIVRLPGKCSVKAATCMPTSPKAAAMGGLGTAGTAGSTSGMDCTADVVPPPPPSPPPPPPPPEPPLDHPTHNARSPPATTGAAQAAPQACIPLAPTPIPPADHMHLCEDDQAQAREGAGVGALPPAPCGTAPELGAQLPTSDPLRPDARPKSDGGLEAEPVTGPAVNRTREHSAATQDPVVKVEPTAVVTGGSAAAIAPAPGVVQAPVPGQGGPPVAPAMAAVAQPSAGATAATSATVGTASAAAAAAAATAAAPGQVSDRPTLLRRRPLAAQSQPGSRPTPTPQPPATGVAAGGLVSPAGNAQDAAAGGVRHTGMQPVVTGGSGGVADVQVPVLLSVSSGHAAGPAMEVVAVAGSHTNGESASVVGPDVLTPNVNVPAPQPAPKPHSHAAAVQLESPAAPTTTQPAAPQARDMFARPSALPPKLRGKGSKYAWAPATQPSPLTRAPAAEAPAGATTLTAAELSTLTAAAGGPGATTGMATVLPAPHGSLGTGAVHLHPFVQQPCQPLPLPQPALMPPSPSGVMSAPRAQVRPSLTTPVMGRLLNPAAAIPQVAPAAACSSKPCCVEGVQGSRSGHAHLQVHPLFDALPVALPVTSPPLMMAQQAQAPAWAPGAEASGTGTGPSARSGAAAAGSNAAGGPAGGASALPKSPIITLSIKGPGGSVRVLRVGGGGGDATHASPPLAPRAAAGAANVLAASPPISPAYPFLMAPPPPAYPDPADQVTEDAGRSSGRGTRSRPASRATPRGSKAAERGRGRGVGRGPRRGTRGKQSASESGEGTDGSGSGGSSSLHDSDAVEAPAAGWGWAEGKEEEEEGAGVEDTALLLLALAAGPASAASQPQGARALASFELPAVAAAAAHADLTQEPQQAVGQAGLEQLHGTTPEDLHSVQPDIALRDAEGNQRSDTMHLQDDVPSIWPLRTSALVHPPSPAPSSPTRSHSRSLSGSVSGASALADTAGMPILATKCVEGPAGDALNGVPVSPHIPIREVHASAGVVSDQRMLRGEPHARQQVAASGFIPAAAAATVAAGPAAPIAVHGSAQPPSQLPLEGLAGNVGAVAQSEEASHREMSGPQEMKGPMADERPHSSHSRTRSRSISPRGSSLQPRRSRRSVSRSPSPQPHTFPAHSLRGRSPTPKRLPHLFHSSAAQGPAPAGVRQQDSPGRQHTQRSRSHSPIAAPDARYDGAPSAMLQEPRGPQEEALMGDAQARVPRPRWHSPSSPRRWLIDPYQPPPPGPMYTDAPAGHVTGPPLFPASPGCSSLPMPPPPPFPLPAHLASPGRVGPSGAPGLSVPRRMSSDMAGRGSSPGPPASLPRFQTHDLPHFSSPGWSRARGGIDHQGPSFMPDPHHFHTPFDRPPPFRGRSPPPRQYSPTRQQYSPTRRYDRSPPRRYSVSPGRQYSPRRYRSPSPPPRHRGPQDGPRIGRGRSPSPFGGRGPRLFRSRSHSRGRDRSRSRDRDRGRQTGWDRLQIEQPRGAAFRGSGRQRSRSPVGLHGSHFGGRDGPMMGVGRHGPGGELQLDVLYEREVVVQLQLRGGRGMSLQEIRAVCPLPPPLLERTTPLLWFLHRPGVFHVDRATSTIRLAHALPPSPKPAASAMQPPRSPSAAAHGGPNAAHGPHAPHGPDPMPHGSPGADPRPVAGAGRWDSDRAVPQRPQQADERSTRGDERSKPEDERATGARDAPPLPPHLPSPQLPPPPTHGEPAQAAPLGGGGGVRGVSASLGHKAGGAAAAGGMPPQASPGAWRDVREYELRLARLLHARGRTTLRELKRTCRMPHAVMTACGGVFGFFEARSHVYRLDPKKYTVEMRPRWWQELGVLEPTEPPGSHMPSPSPPRKRYSSKGGRRSPGRRSRGHRRRGRSRSSSRSSSSSRSRSSSSSSSGGRSRSRDRGRSRSRSRHDKLTSRRSGGRSHRHSRRRDSRSRSRSGSRGDSSSRSSSRSSSDSDSRRRSLRAHKHSSGKGRRN